MFRNRYTYGVFLFVIVAVLCLADRLQTAHLVPTAWRHSFEDHLARRLLERPTAPGVTVLELNEIVTSREAAEDREIHELFDNFNCEHVYLDMGTNIGVQIRKLYEPEKYPGALALPVFDKYFGPGPRCNVCAIGFEPNPSHTKRLNTLQRRYRDAGAGVVIIRGAVGTQTGVLKFGTSSSEKDRNEDWAGSVVEASNSRFGQKHFRPVLTIDVGRIIKLVDARLRQRSGGKRANSKIVAKSDIESSEFLVFSHLIISKAICALDLVFAEWHDHHFRVGQKSKNKKNSGRIGDLEAYEHVKRQKAQLDGMFASGGKKLTQCPTIFSEIDDESYRLDGLPWSEKAFCKTQVGSVTVS